MTTLSWPTTRAFEPARVSWGVRAPSSAWNAFYTGQSQSIVHLGHRLEVTMSLPPCRPAAAAEREAFLMSLAARGDWVRLGHFARRLPLGNVGARAGVTVASAAAAGASSVALAGLTSRANLLTHGSFELDGNSDNLSDGIIREAILRELNRGGQVYFLHNEVDTIENMREKLEKLVPEARIVIGHGQMGERELEKRIDLQPEKLMRVHGQPFGLQALLAGTDAVGKIQHLAFQSLHVFQRHVQKVGAAAGRFEHAHLTQAVMKGVDFS